jgi:hypothetical protein
MELAESAESGHPLTLQDVINFAAACEHLGMRPADIVLSGGVSGWTSRLTGHGPLTRIEAAGAKLPASGWAPSSTAPLIPGLADPAPTTPLPRTDASPSL